MCRDVSNGGSHWYNDLQRLLHGAAPVHSRMLRHELFDLMKRAESGGLTYGRSADVEQMVTSELVLELRLVSRLGDDDGEQIVRMYFTEPESLHACMLALKLAGKRPGPMITQEQNRHAADAAVRAEEYFRTV